MKYILKQMFKTLPKKLMAGVLVTAILASISVPAMAAFGPDRPIKPWTPQENGFNYVTFNSYTGVPNGIGDERDFFRGALTGSSNWTDPVSGVTDGSEVQGHIYIHNDADPNLNDAPGNPGVAKNVTVKVALPTGLATTQQLNATISASNAQPNAVFDTLDVKGNSAFGLNYVSGSATLRNQDGSTSSVSDSLVTTGANIGDQKGCFQYVREITFKMKVTNTQYTVQKFVRLPGQTANDWKKNLSVKPGQTVEWKVEFDNTGNTVLNHVVLLDQLPSNVTVVPGTVKRVDGNFPNGSILGSGAVQNNGTQINVDIGSVNPGINSILAFQTTVNNSKDLECGTHQLVNTGYATPQGYGTIKDSASVTVTGSNTNCQPTPPPVTPSVLPNTGAGDVLGIFAAVTIAGAAAHRLFLGRRFNRG